MNSQAPESNHRDDYHSPDAVYLTIPPRFYLVTSAAIIVGTAVGLVRGSRQASMRYLAENAHHPPTTVKGWYLYHKTKNYKVMFGGLQGAGKDASRLGITALGWVTIEDRMERLGLGDISEIGAAVGTAGIFSIVYRLPWASTRRTLFLGSLIGGSMRLLRWTRERLEKEVEGRRVEVGEGEV